MGCATLNWRLGAAMALVLGLGASASGCIEDADCGVCDPENLVLESISGVNYASDKIHIVSPSCEGERCPSPFTRGSYFVDDLGPCEETEAAQATPSAAEYCRLSPLVTAYGIEFVFNNLLDPTSIELVRKRPDNPQLFEVYDWKTDVLHIEGPITRWNGDYVHGEREEPDLMTRMVNLSCIDNLGPAFGYSHEHYEDPATNPCNDMVDGKPLKMFVDGEVHSYRGIRSAFGNSCSSPQEGPDTCCTYCEWLLSTKIERYGLAVNAAGELAPASPLPDTFIEGDPARPYADAIVCRDGAAGDEVVDTFDACRDFVTAVDRSDEEQRWTYEWCVDPANPTPDCEVAVRSDFRLPRVDLIRETHPDRRPRMPVEGLEPWQWPPRYEKLTAACRTSNDCGEDGHGLPGTSCIGIKDDTHAACLVDAWQEGGCSRDGLGEGLPENVGGYCRPSWTTICADNADTTGDRAYCMDRRFGAMGSAACKVTTDRVDCAAAGERLADGSVCEVGYPNPGYAVGCEEDGTNCDARAGGGHELARCDWNENGRLTGAECCVASLAGPAYADAADGSFACDPFYLSNLVDMPFYERDANLPEQTKNCRCPRSGTLEDHRADLEDSNCLEAVETGCYDDDGNLLEGRAGQYAVKFVAVPGGIVYDPAVKGFDWRPADIGGVSRADIEECAVANPDRLVALDPLNRHDGWRAHDRDPRETEEDFDRAMCSGQEYKVVFNEAGNEDNPAFVVDKVGNTLTGKSVYTFETSQFHVVPGSGFPTDNLRIGACDDYAIRFSNKYDVSAENLAKIQLYRVTCTQEPGEPRICDWAPPREQCERNPDGACCQPVSDQPPYYAPVAGGPGCAQTKAELDARIEAGDECAQPCLVADIGEQDEGELGLRIDTTEFDRAVLVENEVYRMVIPMASTFEAAASDPAVYDAVFWDVCGMPLVAADAVSYTYEFQIDEPKCKEDLDNDGIPFSCDNADNHFNPLQTDMDADSVGDIVDLCPVAGGDASNSADSDRDGVGNVCDNCRQTIDQYNAGATLAGVPAYMQVRNIPYQSDVDGDGIGDVCDNCVWTPNCEGYGNELPLVPWRVADPIAYSNDDVCQRDADGDFVGDACAGTTRDGAAGAIGFANADDFDQDGITNMLDACPRQPLADRIECTTDDDCPAARSCDDGVCNHLDSELPSGDGIGDECDTCPFASNLNQNLEGAMQDEDQDGDFVGRECETQPACDERKDPLPFSFFPVRSNAFCCTTQLVAAQMDYDDPETELQPDVAVGDLLLAGTCESAEEIHGGTCTPLRAPHPEIYYETLPVRTIADCPAEQVNGMWVCRQLPDTVAKRPGILVPPPGCEDALSTAGVTAVQNLLTPLTHEDFDGEPDPFDALWDNICFLPQFDQDYDGFGDSCDLCPFAFDPRNEQFTDPDTNRLYPTEGKYCNGDYLPDNICEAIEEDDGEEEGGSDSGSGSGSGDGGGSSGSGG